MHWILYCFYKILFYVCIKLFLIRKQTVDLYSRFVYEIYNPYFPQ